MFRMVSESMLANVIAFKEAGVSLQELRQSVGRDGGMIIGRGVVLQTPIERSLSDEDARSLIKCYSELLSDYNAGRLDRDCINNLKLRNNVHTKVGVIRNSLQKQSKGRN